MDRRYGEARAFDGTRAVPTSARGEALVRRYLQQARSQNSSAQSYGGSTGGAKSIDPMTAATLLAERSRSAGDTKRIFQEEGSGALGARATLREARKLPEEDLY